MLDRDSAYHQWELGYSILDDNSILFTVMSVLRRGSNHGSDATLRCYNHNGILVHYGFSRLETSSHIDLVFYYVVVYGHWCKN